MSERRMGTAEFKAHCLEAIDDAEKLGQSLTITRQGKPVARLVPVQQPVRKLDRTAFAATFRIVGDIVGPVADPDDWETAH